jgi:thioredoxin-dependent peroxiredoxin
MLKAGDRAPDFCLPDETGAEVSLRDFKGKKVILYFYPKDDTPGCTKEACQFRDHLSEFKRTNTVVLGVSRDSVESHAKFRKKYSLPFSLLSDPQAKLAESYGAWGEKTLYGKKSMGILRSTFVIDETGRIEKVYPKVKPDPHAEELLAYLSG